MTFGDRLKELRVKRSWTQDELSDKLGLQRNNVSHYERSVSQPTLETLVRLADIFHVSTDYLLGREKLEISVDEFAKIKDELIEISDFIPRYLRVVNKMQELTGLGQRGDNIE